MYQVVALVLTLGLVVLLALGVPVGMALAHCRMPWISGKCRRDHGMVPVDLHAIETGKQFAELFALIHSTVHSCSEDHEWFFCHKENL